MKKHNAFCGLVLALALPALAAAEEAKTAEQVYKNIQVMKGVPASDLGDAMWVIRAALGVRCDFCHAPQGYDKDEKKPKETARKMIRMVQAINRDHFEGKNEVTCNTCHNGHSHPTSVPAVLVNIQPRRQPDPSLPKPEQLISKYVDALGGRAALDKTTSRIIKGTRINADGSQIPAEVYQKAPNKVYLAVTSPKFSAWIGFDGANGWARDQRGTDMVIKPLTRREAELFPALPFERFTDAKTAGKENIGDREAYVIEAKAPEGTPEKFYFDVQSGLLVRRMIETKTSLGRLPCQIDYEDYRDADGAKLPYLIRWTTAGIIWSRKVSEVQTNAAIDDSKFAPPAAGAPAGN